jgi:hypothetical protein
MSRLLYPLSYQGQRPNTTALLVAGTGAGSAFYIGGGTRPFARDRAPRLGMSAERDVSGVRPRSNPAAVHLAR